MNIKKKYKYKFSIIMTISENSEFIDETFVSLLEQTISFKENIQLILVGVFKDKNKQIIEKYLEEYKDNIKIVECNFTKPSIAKNKGLKYCSGQYVNLIKSGDLFSKSTFNEVYNFFENNYNAIDMVAVPIVHFGEKDGLHNRYKDFKNMNYIVDLVEEPFNFVISASSTFYKSDIIKQIKFNEQLRYKENIALNFDIYNQNKCFGYVCSDDAKYLSRTMTTNKNSNATVFSDTNIVIGNILKEQSLYDYAKEYVLYELPHQLKDITKDLFEDTKEYDRLIKNYKKYFNMIENEFILKRSKMVSKLDIKYFLLKYKNSNLKLTVTDEWNILSNDIEISHVSDIHIKFKRIECINNYLYIDIMFNDYNINNIDLKFIDSENNTYESYFNNNVKSTYDIKYGEFHLNEMRLVKFKLPIKETNLLLSFINTSNNQIFNIENVSMLSFLKFSLYDEKMKIFEGNHSISFNKKRFVIKKELINNLIYKFKTFLHISMKYKFFAFARLLNNKNKKYILLNDRPEKAGDNGEALFRHINKYEADIAKNTYFVLAKKDEEYKRLKKHGKVVIQNSLKHKYLYMNSKLILSSHACKHFYMPFKIQELKYYVDLLDYKFVWLQHGIIHNSVAKSVNKYNAAIDYFIVSSAREKREIQSERYFYDKDEIWHTGMPRYDYLKSDSKNIISVIPTWRRTLTGKIMKDGFHEIIPGFEKSHYYKEYASLLSNKKLIKLLDKNDFTLDFILHPGMAGYEDSFKKFENDRIKIISAKDVKYKKVFRESNLLITDYSSVAFDFSYLKKPLIYFQFDLELFFGKHYEKGYFDYKKDGFGEVIVNNTDVVKKVAYYFSNDFKTEDIYLKNINKTFAYNDNLNCQRIIDKLKGEKLI